MKIGIPWADLERRLDTAFVLGLCGEKPMEQEMKIGARCMGVDTGKDLHVVVLEEEQDREPITWRLVHLGVFRAFEDLDSCIERFEVDACVIDGMPETHATREFARRHAGHVFMNFFNEHQRGQPQWNEETMILQVNRTEALDASRTAIRERRLVLPKRSPLVEEFAEHLSADAKVLEEEEDTGARRYRYIRTGTNHFSMAFTYAWLAAAEYERTHPRLGPFCLLPERRFEDEDRWDPPTNGTCALRIWGEP